MTMTVVAKLLASNPMRVACGFKNIDFHKKNLHIHHRVPNKIEVVVHRTKKFFRGICGNKKVGNRCVAIYF